MLPCWLNRDSLIFDWSDVLLKVHRNVKECRPGFDKTEQFIDTTLHIHKFNLIKGLNFLTSPLATP